MRLRIQIAPLVIMLTWALAMGVSGVVAATEPSTACAKHLERYERIFAVHATHILPRNGRLIAGARYSTSGYQRKFGEPPAFRPTIHFSLGELVRPHDLASWDEHPYAVVLPLRSIDSQLVNVSAHDAFIMGDLRLPPDATYVIPENKTFSAPDGARVIRYGPGETLRQAVDRAIASGGGRAVRMDNTASATGGALMDGVNINTTEFFAPLLASRPYLSFGDHVHSEVGEMNRLGLIAQALDGLMLPFRPSGPRLLDAHIRFFIAFIDQQLPILDRLIGAADLPAASLKSYRNKRADLMHWLNVIEVERRLRAERGLTLTRADAEVFATLARLKSDVPRLNEFVRGLVDQRALQPAPSDPTAISPAVAALFLSGSDVGEVEAFLKLDWNGWSVEQTQTFRILQLAKRILVINEERANTEGLFDRLDEALRFAPASLGAELAKDLFELLREALDEQSSRLPLTLRVFGLRSARALWRDHLGLSLHGSVTFDAIVRGHPATTYLYERADQPLTSPATHKAAELIERLGARIDPAGPQSVGERTFNKMRSLAFNLKWADEFNRKVITRVTTPMSSTIPIHRLSVGQHMSLYEMMARGDYGSLDEIAAKLGLQSDFRRVFKRDADFWASDLSLLEIYHRLKGR